MLMTNGTHSSGRPLKPVEQTYASVGSEVHVFLDVVVRSAVCDSCRNGARSTKLFASFI